MQDLFKTNQRCLLGLLLSLWLAPALAQVPTAQQLQRLQELQNLSPAQQAKLLNAAGQQSTIPSVSPITQPQTITPRSASPGTGKGADSIEKNAAKAAASVSLAEPKEEKVVKATIKQFGYDLFAGTPTTFAPATDIPVPSTYVMDPGDTVLVQLYGKLNDTYKLPINRDGNLQFPSVGPISVAGLSFAELKQQLLSIVDTHLIGQKASITLGQLRSIRIFVLGEAHRPGSYTVSALSNMSNALFVSGGITRVGSLRNIQLKRQGKLITTFDLYDLLLKGDTSADQRLLPGDVLFIPPIGATVGISGEVKRPAIFEIKQEKTAEEIVKLAGGLMPTAYPQASRIERISSRGDRTLVDIDLSTKAGKQQKIQDGDIIQIFSILEKMENIVLLKGHVHRPGGFQWHKSLRVSDLVPSIQSLLPNPDLAYALIKREIQPTRTIKVLYVNLGKAIVDPGSLYDLPLQARDELHIFGVANSRDQQVSAIVQQLKQQADYDNLPKVVNISGNVRFPGQYPLFEGMQAIDLIHSASGLQAETELETILLQRQINKKGNIEVLNFPIDPDSKLLSKTNFNLQAQDHLYLVSTNQARAALLAPIIEQLKSQTELDQPAQIISIDGYVKYPGTYPRVTHSNIENLIAAAGGLLESADIYNAEVTRYMNDPFDGREIEHISIALADIVGTGNQFQLQPYDHLFIKQLPNWSAVETVSITGEVRSPGTYAITSAKGKL